MLPFLGYLYGARVHLRVGARVHLSDSEQYCENQRSRHARTTATSQTKQTRRSGPGRVTLAAVRQKCRDCLNVGKVGYDCQVPTYSLYPWQPWPGRAMPSR